MNNKFKRFLSLITIFIIVVVLFTITPLENVYAEGNNEDSNVVSEYIAKDLEEGEIFRDADDARKVGADFLDEQDVSLRLFAVFDKQELDLVYPYSETAPRMLVPKSVVKEETSPLYIFNRKGGGFVIVSGDKRGADILGYSLEGSFDLTNAPEHLQDWIYEYENQIGFIRDNPEKFEAAIEDKILLRAGEEMSNTAVQPFMAHIVWDQSDPFNRMAPEYAKGEKSATGCVATAMAQVMKYYEHPTQGTGHAIYTWKNRYTEEEKVLSSDISTHMYDWENMPNSYARVTDEAQIKNIAQLMYDAGVAVEMQYGQSSGAFSKNAAKAFTEYFGFDKSLKYIHREYYNTNEWKDIVKSELVEKRPVFYGGSGKTGGHQFILDGMDTMNLYHVNWGWSGRGNGYYALDAMNPSDLGTGSAGGSYNMKQDMIVGLMPDKNEIVQTNIRAYNLNEVRKQEDSEYINLFEKNLQLNKKSIVYSKWQLSIEDLKGFRGNYSLGVEIDGEIRVFNEILKELETGNYTVSLPIIWRNLQNVPDGEYKIQLYIKPEGDSEYGPVHGKDLGKDWKPDILKARVEGDNVTYYYVEDAERLELKLSEFKRDPEWELYEGSTGKFNANIVNYSPFEYNSLMYLKLENKTSRDDYIIGGRQVVLQHMENREIEFFDDLKAYDGSPIPAGKYYVKVLYNNRNNQVSIEDEGGMNNYRELEGSQWSGAIEVEIKEAQKKGTVNFTEFPKFTAELEVENEKPIVRNAEDLQLTATVRADGGMVEGSIIGYIFPSTGGNSLDSISSNKFRVESGKEKTINFKYAKESLDDILEDDESYFIMFEYDGNGTSNERLWFTYVTPAEVDKAALNEAISKAESLIKEDYSEESYFDLESALLAAKLLVDNTSATQEAVNAATKTLNDAIESLEPIVVDKTELKAAIDKAKLVDKEKYTATSVATLESALSAAETVYEDSAATDTMVEEATTNLNAAMTGLEAKPVDKTELKVAIDKANEKLKNEGDYTEDSVKALKAALEAAEKALTEATTQDEIDTATKNLTDAIGKLVELNKEALKAVIAEAEAIEKDKYTPESVTALETALTAAEKALTEATTQDEIDAAATNLTNAISGLQDKPVELNKAALEAAITEAETIDRTKYTAESLKLLDEALTVAEKALTEATTQDEIDAAATNLTNAISGLQDKPVELNKAALEKAISEAEAIDRTKYTAESLKLLDEALEAAEKALTEATTQDEIDTATKNLTDAIGKLVELNKEALKAVIAEAEAIEKDKYTPESVTALETALTAAEKALTEATTQDEIDAAATNLTNAISGLQDKPVELNKAALEAAITEAETIDRTKYTAESLKLLDEALTVAEKALTEATTQDEIDAAATNLTNAISGLQDKPVELNKAALEKAISEAEAIDRTKYTAESLKLLDEALEAAEKALTEATTQVEIDTATKNLTDAIGKLVELNKEALKAVIAEAEAIEKDKYTPESVTALETALTAAEKALTEATTQDEIDAAATNLTNAISGLQDKPVELNKAALEAAITEAETIDRTKYTAESLKLLDEALTVAEKALTEATTQDEIDAAATNLTNAIKGLELKDTPIIEDKSQLIVEIKNAERYLDNRDKYTEDSVSELLDALRKAEEVRDDENSTGPQISAAIRDLERAVKNLEYKSERPGKDEYPPYFGTIWGSKPTAKEDIEEKVVKPVVVNKAYLTGYEDGTVRPNDNLTRAEVATILVRLMGAEMDLNGNSNLEYSDLKTGDWYSKYISFVTEKNIMQGYEDGTFRPNEKITRAELVAVISRFKSLEEKGSSFEDVKGHWAEKHIGSIESLGWIKGYEDGRFKPEQLITRAEAVKIINAMEGRTFNSNNYGENMKAWSDNMDTSKWYYKDIQIATNPYEAAA